MKHIGDVIAVELGGTRSRISAEPIGKPPKPGQECEKCRDWAQAVWCVSRWMLPDLCDACVERARERDEKERLRDIARRMGRRPLLFPTNPGEYVCPPDGPGDRSALNAVSQWKPERLGKWLYLHGRAGVGKTHLASFQIRQHHVDNDGSAMITAAELVSKYRACFDRTSSDSQADIDRTYKLAPILVLDDLGTESITPYTNEIIFALIDNRITCGRPTIITSNYSIQKLASRIGNSKGLDFNAADRLGSRLAGQCIVVEVRAQDFRRHGQ